MYRNIAIAILINLFAAEVALSHSGRTNSEGCHNNRKTGGYHCHNGGYKNRNQSSYSRSSSSSSFNSSNQTIPSTALPARRTKPKTYEEFQSVVFETEEHLKFLGYDIDKVDGILDPRTSKAIKLFQKRKGLPITGMPMNIYEWF